MEDPVIILNNRKHSKDATQVGALRATDEAIATEDVTEEAIEKDGPNERAEKVKKVC